MMDFAKIPKEQFEKLKEEHTKYWELQSPMPCGHLARYAVNEEAGTQYCALCELEEKQQTIDDLQEYQ